MNLPPIKFVPSASREQELAKVDLPPVPNKRYFSIGEISEICDVKAHVLRFWENEFPQLKPMKRRGNRRYYQHHEVLLIRRIRELLYQQGFTIAGARRVLMGKSSPGKLKPLDPLEPSIKQTAAVNIEKLRQELLHVRDLLASYGQIENIKR